MGMNIFLFFMFASTTQITGSVRDEMNGRLTCVFDSLANVGQTIYNNYHNFLNYLSKLRKRHESQLTIVDEKINDLDKKNLEKVLQETIDSLRENKDDEILKEAKNIIK